MAQPLSPADRALTWAQQAALIVVASIFVALCARVTLPLPFTPVPLTMQNLGVLLVGLMLGRERGFAALALYLAEGLAGMPVFNPTGPGGDRKSTRLNSSHSQISYAVFCLKK